MHKLDENRLVTPALLKRFHAEAECEGGDGRFAAFIQRSNGEIISHDNGPRADPRCLVFTMEILGALNRHLHHDGAWVIVFTHWKAPVIPMQDGVHQRFVLLWMDGDGDVQFPLEWVGGIDRAVEFGGYNWSQHAASAWHLWHHVMRVVLDPQEGETYKRALGESAPSVH